MTIKGPKILTGNCRQLLVDDVNKNRPKEFDILFWKKCKRFCYDAKKAKFLNSKRKKSTFLCLLVCVYPTMTS